MSARDSIINLSYKGWIMVDYLNQGYIVENKWIQKISNFLYTDYYFLTLISLIFICWLTNAFLVGLAIIVLLACAILIIQRDVTPIIPILLMGVAVISQPKVPDNLGVIIVCYLTPVLASIIFHFYWYRTTEFKFGKMSFSMILVFIACLLGGVGSRLPKDGSKTIIAAFLIGMVPLIFYLLIINLSKMPEDKNILEFMANALIYFGVLVTIQMGTFYFKNWDAMFRTQGGIIPHLGWGISNTVANLLLIVIPFGFYLFYSMNNWKQYVYVVLSTIVLGCICATTSRGGTIFAMLEFFVCILITLIKSDRKKRIRFLYIAIGYAVLMGLAIALGLSKLKTAWDLIFHDGMADSGRLELYREAIGCFFEYPVFGTGLTYRGAFDMYDDTGMYLFHNVILQIAASMGFVGIACFVYYYFRLFQTIFEEMNFFGYMVIAMLIGFYGYNMLNTGGTTGYPHLAYVAFIVAVYELYTKQGQSQIYSRIKLKTIKYKKEHLGGENGR